MHDWNRLNLSLVPVPRSQMTQRVPREGVELRAFNCTVKYIRQVVNTDSLSDLDALVPTDVSVSLS